MIICTGCILRLNNSNKKLTYEKNNMVDTFDNGSAHLSGL